MSKLASIKAYQRSPMYMGDGLFSKLAKGAVSLFKKGKKAVGSISQLVQSAAPSVAGLVEDVVEGVGGGGAPRRRRRRGITARELSGYRKVANLLHKEGMVSRRARGRK